MYASSRAPEEEVARPMVVMATSLEGSLRIELQGTRRRSGHAHCGRGHFFRMMFRRLFRMSRAPGHPKKKWPGPGLSWPLLSKAVPTAFPYESGSSAPEEEVARPRVVVATSLERCFDSG